jgi:DNA-directed RNA polymerase specialized sigma24 family protein
VGRSERPKRTPEELGRVRQLYVNEAADLYRYACFRPGADVFGAEDLVQTAFQEAILEWDKVGLLTVDGQRRWLRRVLPSHCHDRLRVTITACNGAGWLRRL